MKSEYAIKRKIKELKESEEQTPTSKTVIETLEWVVQPEKNHEIELQFDRLWFIYTSIKNNEPRKGPRFTEKKAARQFFSKMDSSSRRLALENAEAFIKNKPFDGYTHPALIRYLRHERWEEIIDMERTSPCQNHDSEIDKILKERYGDKL